MALHPWFTCPTRASTQSPHLPMLAPTCPHQAVCVLPPPASRPPRPPPAPGHPAPGWLGRSTRGRHTLPRQGRQGCCRLPPAKGGPGTAPLHGSRPLAAPPARQAGLTGTPAGSDVWVGGGRALSGRAKGWWWVLASGAAACRLGHYELARWINSTMQQHALGHGGGGNPAHTPKAMRYFEGGSWLIGGGEGPGTSPRHDQHLRNSALLL